MLNIKRNSLAVGYRSEKINEENCQKYRSCEHGNGPTDSIKGGELLDQLSDC
jgi:hypothetical protein